MSAEPAVDRGVELGARHDLVDEAHVAAPRAAVMRWPVSIMPMAWRNGIWRCSSVMPPSSGMRPTRASGRPKLASSHGHDDVAAQHHLEAAAEGVAVDARDHRHVERLAQRDAAEAARPRRGPVFEAA